MFYPIKSTYGKTVAFKFEKFTPVSPEGVDVVQVNVERRIDQDLVRRVRFHDQHLRLRREEDVDLANRDVNDDPEIISS